MNSVTPLWPCGENQSLALSLSVCLSLSLSLSLSRSLARSLSFSLALITLFPAPLSCGSKYKMCDPLIELIDDIVLMYHVGAHKQLRKMSTLRENMQVSISSNVVFVVVVAEGDRLN